MTARQRAAQDRMLKRLRDKGLGLAPHAKGYGSNKTPAARAGVGAATAVQGSGKAITHAGGSDRSTGLVAPEAIEGEIATFIVPGEPVSKARSRFTQRGSTTRSYTPEKTRDAEILVADAFRLAAPGHVPDPDLTYGIIAIFYCATRQRRDVDNMIKLLCDGLNGVAWPDDVQVDEVIGKRLYDDDARTEVTVYVTGRVEKPSGICQHCGETFLLYKSQTKRKYCSNACVSAARKATRMTTCRCCGVEFDGRQQVNKPIYCSVECRRNDANVDVECHVCAKSFRMARSLAADRTRHICGPECQAIRDAECSKGHPWEGNERRRPDGRKYCAACNRDRAAA